MNGRVAVAAGLMLVAVCVVNYWPVFTGHVPLPADIVFFFPPFEGAATPAVRSHAEMSDLITQIYPWRAFAAECVKNGMLPLWNPYLLAGSPFLANAQSALFYPPNFIFYALPTTIAWPVSLILRTILAGLFASMLARSLGASAAGATAGGLVFALSGFMTSWQGFPMADAALWLPLVLFGIDRLAKGGSKRTFALLSVALAMPVLAGHPETAAHVGLVAVIFAAYRTRHAQFVLLFAGAAVLAMLIAAVQMFPTLEWLPYIKTSLESTWPPRPLHEMLAFLSRDTTRTPNAAGIFLPEAAAYVGPVALLLSVGALFHRNRRDAIFFSILLAMCLMVAYGFGPGHWLISRAPILSGLKNWRLLFAADLSIAMLASLGLSAIKPRMVGACLLAILSVDLVTFSYGYMPFVPTARIFPRTSVFDFLSRQEKPFRVAAVNVTTGSNFEMPYRVPTAGGYDIQLRRFLNFVSGLSEPGMDLVSLDSERIIQSTDKRLDLLNVKYLIASTTNKSAERLEARPDRFRLAFSSRSVRVFENLSVVPKAYFVPLTGVEVVPDEFDQLAKLNDSAFAPEKTILLETAPQRIAVANDPGFGLLPGITDFVQRTNEVHFTAVAAEPGILVLSEVHYPGWKVFVNGIEQPLLRANHAFMGVAVDAGFHAVRFVFDPASFEVGLACSLAGLVVIGVILIDRRVIF